MSAGTGARTASRFTAGLGALLFCGALGSACVLGFAPFYFWLVPVASLAVLAWLIDQAATPRRATMLGFCFGLGYFLTGVSWVYVSMTKYGGMAVPVAAFATLFFCSYLALFPAAAAWIARRIPVARGVRLTLAFPAAWVSMEWVRGWMFTGFPWLGVGYSQSPGGPLAGYAPVLGVYGVALLAALTAGLLAWWAPWPAPFERRRMLHPAPWIALVVWLAGLSLAQVSWSQPSGGPTSVSLLQGNIRQELKWRPEAAQTTLETYLRLTRASSSRLILLPETAVPMLNVDVPSGYLELLTAHARGNGGDVLLGIPEYVEGNPGRLYNSVMSFGVSPAQTYRKHHLVPFGDYFPQWTFISWVMNAMQIPMSSFSRGDAVQTPLAVAGQHVAVNICYEDAFGEEVIRQLPRATLLANFTNDAWWGESFASEQHLQISQMRAQETGRYMLRATNTGVTAIIDQRGRVLAAAPQFVTTVLDGMVQGYSGSTPYVRWGNWPVLALLAVLLAVAVAASGRRE
jgi:apolipoprotein N-acyltransferase